MRKTETYTSCLHVHVRFHIYEPSIALRVKGIVQIHHGLGEHADLYDHFATYLANHGYIAVVSDFVGHGQSLIDFEQGFFGLNEGSEGLVKDMFHLYSVIRDRYQEAPYYLLGTDLGALVIRKFLSLYGEYIQGAILLGTNYGTKHIRGLHCQVKVLKLLKGPMYHSKIRVSHKDVSQVDWRTSDEELKQEYLNDPMTNFKYTLKGYEDILAIAKQVNSSSYIEPIPTYLSIYIGVGKEDALVDNSHQLYEVYKKHGIKDVAYEEFENDRHALLFESDRMMVYQSILKWLDERGYI